MFEKHDGIVAAYPDGESGVVEVHSQKADAVTEPTAKKLVEKNKKFKVTSFEKQVVAKAKPPAEQRAKPKRES